MACANAVAMGLETYIKITGYEDGQPPVIQFKEKWIMAEITHCPACVKAGMEYRTNQTLIVRCDEIEEAVSNLSGWFCPHCGDAVLDDDSAMRHAEAGDRVVLKAREQLPATIRQIRKKLGLTQRQAGQLFGGGASAFSEYEVGKTRPSRSTLLLLRILDRHPELLNEIQAA